MEKFIENQKQELLKNGAQDLQDKDDAWDEHQEAERDPVEEKDDSWDNEDLTYITAIRFIFKAEINRPILTRGCTDAHANPNNAAAKI
jgi:hypothetical protein